MHTVQYFAILLGTVFILPWNITHAATSDSVGTTYPSQKISFTDPVTNRTVWRMTVDGIQHGALNNLGDVSGMEGNRFSPDSTKICYAKTGHPSKPEGYYVMNLSTGVETYVAPIGSWMRWGSCVFSSNSNELFHYYINRGSSPSTSWGEIRAVNLSTHSVRVLRRYAGMERGNVSIALNSDGTYLALVFGLVPESSTTEQSFYTVILSTSNGSEHPNWRFDATRPSYTTAMDHVYWHQSNPKVIRAKRASGGLKMWNIDTLAQMPNPIFMGELNNLYSAHNCQTVDGAIQFHTWGHADCHPLDRGRGEDTRAVIDNRNANTPYVYITAFKNADGYGTTPPDGDRVAVHYNYADGTHNYAHSHPHFSRDARYVLFSSAVNNTVAGTPPGGTDNDTYTVDLFVIPLDGSSTTPPPTTPSTCTNQQTSTASIPTGYGASYNPLTSAREYLVQASCTNTTSATITAGNGNPLTYVYNRGYYYSGTAWTPYTLTCASGALISGAWCPGRATASIPLPQNPTNVIAYTCQYTNSTWKCGCRDATCSTAYWQLQRVGR